MVSTGLSDHPDFVAVKTRVPPIYRSPLGLPLRWQDDTSGELPTTMRKYFKFMCGDGPEPAADERTLILDYLQHVLCAPCWNRSAQDCPEVGAELIRLRLAISRDRAIKLRTWKQLDRWITRCLSLGIDPL